MNNLWVEKYRPNTLDGYVFRDSNQRQQIESWVKEKTIPIITSFIEEDDVISQFIQNSDNSIVLSYSNQRVTELNTKIRRKLFSIGISQRLERLYIGEKLIFSGYRATPQNVYNTSDIIEIKELSIIELKINNYVEYNIGDNLIKYFLIIDQHNVSWYKPYNQVAHDSFEIARIELLKICKREKQKKTWKIYYSFIERFNPSLSYSYCSTVHKSQGSEWNNVFVDRSNIISCCYNDIELQLRALYTAVSRMKEKIFIF